MKYIRYKQTGFAQYRTEWMTVSSQKPAVRSQILISKIGYEWKVERDTEPFLTVIERGFCKTKEEAQAKAKKVIERELDVLFEKKVLREVKIDVDGGDL